MNKKELVAKVSEKCGLNKKNANTIVSAIIEEITNTLVDGEKVQLSGFGTFNIKQRDSRICYNPKTDKRVKVPAVTAAAFKPGKVLKTTINNSKQK